LKVSVLSGWPQSLPCKGTKNSNAYEPLGKIHSKVIIFADGGRNDEPECTKVVLYAVY
jgi:hypothetical protein